MHFTQTDIKKLARLSRLGLDEANVDNYADDLSKIVGFIEQLNELDTTGITPMTGAVNMTQRLRDDVINDGGCPERVTSNATDTTMHFFTVPKVVE